MITLAELAKNILILLNFAKTPKRNVLEFLLKNIYILVLNYGVGWRATVYLQKFQI